MQRRTATKTNCRRWVVLVTRRSLRDDAFMTAFIVAALSPNHSKTDVELDIATTRYCLPRRCLVQPYSSISLRASTASFQGRSDCKSSCGLGRLKLKVREILYRILCKGSYCDAVLGTGSYGRILHLLIGRFFLVGYDSVQSHAQLRLPNLRIWS